jgi:hypothetical protein
MVPSRLLLVVLGGFGFSKKHKPLFCAWLGFSVFVISFGLLVH